MRNLSRKKPAGFLKHLILWIVLYVMSERGSTESRQPSENSSRGFVWRKIRDHSLLIFLALTGIGWIVLYARLNPESKWGQVVGNIVSEWTQIFGLVVMTTRLIETYSKESRK